MELACRLQRYLVCTSETARSTYMHLRIAGLAALALSLFGMSLTDYLK